MSIETATGAALPSTPTQPGLGGFREFRNTSTGEKIKRKASRLRAAVERKRNYDDETDGIRESLHASMDLVGAILTVVIAGAVAFAGINVMSSIGESMAINTAADPINRSVWGNASVALENGLDSFFTQLPTVFVVIALVLIISYLTILRKR